MDLTRKQKKKHAKINKESDREKKRDKSDKNKERTRKDRLIYA